MYKSIFYALVIQWNPFNAVTMGQKIWPKNGWPYYISVQAQRVIMTNAPYNAFEFLEQLFSLINNRDVA